MQSVSSSPPPYVPLPPAPPCQSCINLRHQVEVLQGLELNRAQRPQVPVPQAAEQKRSFSSTASLTLRTAEGLWERVPASAASTIAYLATCFCCCNDCNGFSKANSTSTFQNFYIRSMAYLRNQSIAQVAKEDLVCDMGVDHTCCGCCCIEPLTYSLKNTASLIKEMIVLSLKAVSHTATLGCCCNCCGEYDPLHLGLPAVLPEAPQVQRMH